MMPSGATSEAHNYRDSIALATPSLMVVGWGRRPSQIVRWYTICCLILMSRINLLNQSA